MLGSLRALAAGLRIGSLQRRDHGADRDDIVIENLDAGTAAAERHKDGPADAGTQLPPGYVND